jgi:hypothetical protein
MPEELQPAWQGQLIEPPGATPIESVGGWLIIFCISYAVLSPIGLLRGVRLSSPNYWTFTYLVLAIFMFLAGTTTWLRAKSAFTFISFALVMRFIFAVMQLNFAYRLHAHNLKLDFVNREIWTAVGNIAATLLWFWYFKVSSRVERTFGRNL